MVLSSLENASLELVLPAVLVLPGLVLTEWKRFKFDSAIERISASYVLSLILTLVPLYLGGTFGQFRIASYIVFSALLISLLYFPVRFAVKLVGGSSPVGRPGVSLQELPFVACGVALLTLFAVFLAARALIDYDVVQYYLPLARQIATGNTLTQYTASYFAPIYQPIGASVLYGWTYAVTGSVASESFRLLPLVPVSLIILMIYQLTRFASESKLLGLLASSIFMVATFTDKFLLVYALYPDIYYYPLLFFAFYYLVKHFKSDDDSCLPWVGVAIGLASLFKAETVFAAIAVGVVLLVFESRGRDLPSLALSLSAPWLVLVPLGLTGQLGAVTFSASQAGVLVILTAFSGLAYLLLRPGRGLSPVLREFSVIALLRKAVYLAAPIGLFGGLGYLVNYLRYGTLIWIASTSPPNFSWAQAALTPPSVPIPIPTYSLYLSLMSLDPAVFGLVWLVPLLVGILVLRRRGSPGLRTFVFLQAVLASVILSYYVTVGLPYNPRDVVDLAPGVAALSALGLVFATAPSNAADRSLPAATFVLVAMIGALGFVQGYMAWFFNDVTNSGAIQFANFFAGRIGLTVGQLGLHMMYDSLVPFEGQHLLEYLRLPYVAGAALFFAALPRIIRRTQSSAEGAAKTATVRMNQHDEATKHGALKSLLVSLMLVLVVVAPVASVVMAQGGLGNLKEDELSTEYSFLYSIVTNQTAISGGVLTYGAQAGLPYYLPNERVVDLDQSANLAYLRTTLQSGNASSTVDELASLGIHNLLVSRNTLPTLTALGLDIPAILQDPGLCKVTADFGIWELCALGHYPGQ